jgi:alpha-N-arabinofuranosidase
MTGMERNADLIIMSCYAPLFVNVNTATSTAPKAWQWDSDLIGYDALNSYGSPSYYVQKLFGNLLGDKVVPITASNIPTQAKPLSKKDSTDGLKATQVPTVFYSATMDEKTGNVYLKLVNTTAKKQPVNINLNGVGKVSPDATISVIKGSRPEDTNTITAPEKFVPVSAAIKGVAAKFKRTLEPYSVSVFQLQVSK